MKPITITKELKDAVEYYTAMKDVKRIAFTEYCNLQTDDNKASYDSAVNAVSYGESQIATIIENHFKGESNE